MDEEQIKIGPDNTLFAGTMDIATSIGLFIILAAGIFYFTGLHDMVNAHSAIQNWDKTAPEFWEATTGNRVGGYSWFVDHLTTIDGVTILGVAFLAFVPLLSVLVVLPKATRPYKFILGLLILEFILAILRPIL